jgi:D-galactarolactone cycloisomerase
LQIAHVDTYPLFYPLEQPYGDANGYKKYRTCLLLRVTTEDGITGWGECIDWLPTLEKGFKERIIPYLIGQQATDRLQIVKVIKKWHQRAAAGVSMALTEIVAKSANLSVCDLWGGKWRATIPVYASFQSYRERDDWMDYSLRLVEQAVTDGFRQVKVKVGGRTIKDDKKHITSLQHLLAEEVQVAIDANQSYDLSTAKQWETILRQWNNVMWFEEPMPMDRVKDYRLLRSSISIPIAGGENLLNATQFVPLLREGALDIIQPDTMHIDGVEEFRNTLHLARIFGLRCSPHAFDGSLSRLYALFAQACLAPWSKMKEDQIEALEWDVMENPFNQIVPIKPVSGSVAVPTGIGIGVELDHEIIEAYRWDGGHYV